MRDFFYDLRRTFTGRFTLIVIAVILIISAGLGYILTSAANASSPATQVNVSPDIYYNNSTDLFYIMTYATNGYGQPLGGVPITVQINGTYYNGTSLNSGYYNLTYNAQGLNLSYADYAIGYHTTLGSTRGGSTTYYGGSLSTKDSYNKNGSFDIRMVTKLGTQVYHDLNIVYFSHNGDPSPQVGVYYRLVNISNQNQGYSYYSEANMTYYGNIGGFYTSTIFLNLPAGDQNRTMVVELFNSTGAIVGGPVVYSPATLLAGKDIANIAFTIYSDVFGLIIPIIATLSAYFYFGKDKASGVLESVITRPVTKGRLITSRYLATVTSIIGSFALGALIFDLFLVKATGSFLPMDYFLSLIWVYLVEIGAFTGLVYLASQFLKSQGAILGVAIALFLIYGFLWTSLITPLVLQEVLHLTLGTNAYQYYAIIMDGISPSGYNALMLLNITSTGASGSTINPASFGITATSLGIIGALWLLVPGILAILIGRRRD